MSRQRVLSGIQPTADSFHMGNFLGAVRHWVALQETHDAFYCVVDLHAITVPHDPVILRQRTRLAAAQLLAVGLDPDRCTLFLQSHVREHAELAWVLSCITGYGEASRMTQFKDKSQRNELGAATVGLFTYPILQAADILLYHATAVPVGEDQRQHLELTRDLAGRFNARFGETFTVPEPLIIKETAKISDLQAPSLKMSKSSQSQAGVIDLLEDPATTRKKVMRAVTDTDSTIAFSDDKPGVSNLLTINSALSSRSIAELEVEFAGKGYGDLKRDTADVIEAAFTPYLQRTREWLEDPERLDAVLADGAKRASAVAAPTMAQVCERVGFLPLRG